MELFESAAWNSVRGPAESLQALDSIPIVLAIPDMVWKTMPGNPPTISRLCIWDKQGEPIEEEDNNNMDDEDDNSSMNDMPENEKENQYFRQNTGTSIAPTQEMQLSQKAFEEEISRYCEGTKESCPDFYSAVMPMICSLSKIAESDKEENALLQRQILEMLVNSNQRMALKRGRQHQLTGDITSCCLEIENRKIVARKKPAKERYCKKK